MVIHLSQDEIAQLVGDSIADRVNYGRCVSVFFDTDGGQVTATVTVAPDTLLQEVPDA